jgi:O-succinylbenzoate synthase
LAAALPELPFACGLGTVELLAGDVTEDPLVPRSGSIRVRDVTIGPDLLERWQAPADAERWWRERVTRCYGLLTGMHAQGSSGSGSRSPR